MSPGSYEKVAYEVADGVATVTLNDPEKRNMLSGQMLAELVDAMKRARDAEEVRAVVLTGAGGAFSAGADLKEAAMNPPEGDVIEQAYHPTIRIMRDRKSTRLNSSH